MFAPALDSTSPLAAPTTQSTRLAIALTVSLVLHVVLLATHFIAAPARPEPDKWVRKLEVVLVNAKSAEAPLKPDALAQTNLGGGGNTEADERLASPLPASPRTQASERTAALAQRVQKLEEKARTLMTQIDREPEIAKPKPAPTVADLQRQAREVARQEAEEMAQLQARIAQQQNVLQNGPKRAYVGANTKEYLFARYVEDWVAKVERIGNLNYPEAARREHIYDKLQMTVSVRSDGTLEKIVIDHPSQWKVLNAAAEKIVRLGEPYAPFSTEMRQKVDILDITRTWTFTRSDQLSGGD